MSSIDLALCSPAIALNYHWQPKNDTFGSDHFPIIISSTKSSSPSPQFQQYWKINKADWTNFAQKCENSLNESANITSIEQFVDSLVSKSNDTIPKTRSKMKRIKNSGSLTTANKLLSNARKPFATYETILHPPISIDSISAEPKREYDARSKTFLLEKLCFQN